MHDVIVIGAGPAGAIAARQLAQAGRRVLVADRPTPVRLQIGETLPGAAVRLLSARAMPTPSEDGPHERVSGTLSAWASNAPSATDAIRDPYGPSWRLDRKRFDADLRMAAHDMGAGLIAARLRSVKRLDDGWRLTFDDGETHAARFVVDASGRRAALARRLGETRQRDSQLIALYRIGQAAPGFEERRTLIVSTASGWWYAARLPNGYAIAGLHTDLSHAADIRRRPDLWRTTMATAPTIAALLEDTEFDCALPPVDAGGSRLSRFHGDGWIACGDAALSFDPIAGQGIFSALHSGWRCAEAVHTALAGDTAPILNYAAEMEQVWRIYAARRRTLYAQERRWPDSTFWKNSQTFEDAA